MLRVLKADIVDYEIDEFGEAEAPIKVQVPVRRHRIITTSRVGHATPQGKAEFAAARLTGELEVKPNLASVCREFGTYPKAVKQALAKLRGNNRSVAETPIAAAWRIAPEVDVVAFVAANAGAIVRANPNAILSAIDNITTP